MAGSMVASASFQSLRLRLNPGDEAFDHPSPLLDSEADLIGLALDKLDGDGRGFRDTRSLIAFVYEDLADEGKRSPRGLQNRTPTIAILDACRVRKQHQRPTVGVDQRVMLAAVDLLASTDATGSVALSGDARCFFVHRLQSRHGAAFRPVIHRCIDLSRR